MNTAQQRWPLSPGSGSFPVCGQTDDPIVLGTHTDLTGAIAIWGVGHLERRAHALRRSQRRRRRPTAGPIRFIVEDSNYQIPRAIAAANKLINRDKILAMVMAVGTPTNVAVMEQPFAKDVPNLFPATGARAMWSRSTN